MNKEQCEIHLPYYKQGDDLGHFLENAGGIPEALEQHALMLEDAASILRKVKEILVPFAGAVEFQADTHMIWVSGSEDAIKALVDAGVAEYYPFDDDEDDGDSEDGDEFDEDEDE